MAVVHIPTSVPIIPCFFFRSTTAPPTQIRGGEVEKENHIPPDCSLVVAFEENGGIKVVCLRPSMQIVDLSPSPSRISTRITPSTVLLEPPTLSSHFPITLTIFTVLITQSVNTKKNTLP